MEECCGCVLRHRVSVAATEYVVVELMSGREYGGSIGVRTEAGIADTGVDTVPDAVFATATTAVAAALTRPLLTRSRPPLPTATRVE